MVQRGTLTSRGWRRHPPPRENTVEGVPKDCSAPSPRKPRRRRSAPGPRIRYALIEVAGNDSRAFPGRRLPPIAVATDCCVPPYTSGQPMKNNVARVYLLRGTKKRPPHKDGLIVLWSPVPSIPILAGVSK